MKSIKSCILVVAVLAATSSFMGCDKHSNTLASITVTPTNQYMAKGTTQQFNATATLTNGDGLLWTQGVTWSTSDASIATVNNTAGLNGIVTSLATGTVIISALDVINNISDSVTLVVTDPDSIIVLPTNPFMAVGTTHQFTALALFSGGTVTQDITLSAAWSAQSYADATITSTPGVAGTGIVTSGTLTGTTTIQAELPISNGTKTADTTLYVTSTPLASITVSPVNPVISLSTTTQFTATGTFQDGTTTQGLISSATASWYWSSSNTAVATIDVYTGIAQAVTAGAVTITATDPITGIIGSTTFTLQ